MTSSVSLLYGISRTNEPSASTWLFCFECHFSYATHRAASGENRSVAHTVLRPVKIQ